MAQLWNSMGADERQKYILLSEENNKLRINEPVNK
jgi:hypothetical protein